MPLLPSLLLLLLLALLLVLLVDAEEASKGYSDIRWGPLRLSFQDPTRNLKDIHDFVQQVYYSQFREGMPAASFRETWGEIELGFQELGRLAESVPALLFPVGIELYHWFFFRWQNGSSIAELDREAMGTAAALILRSITMEVDCQGEGEVDRGALERFILKGCDYRWTHLVMIEAEVGRELARQFQVSEAAGFLQRAQDHLEALVRLPYFASRNWATPYEMNYNEEMFPTPGPVWPRDSVPLVAWLEEHFGIFREELDAIRAVPGLFDYLHNLERNAEGQDHAPEEDWTIVELADTREEEPWKLRICEHAPRSCQLLRGRREFGCDHAAAYLNRMRPGAWIKPHLGGPPRLVAHLGLVVPPQPIELYVGAAQLRWETGKAHVIDDTYVHSVRHFGVPGVGGEDRFILHLLLCHPCEASQRELYSEVRCP